ncbi:MAG: phosphoribosylformylglycinamidine synthase subunit PurQ [Rickettsiales bacterium]|nr:phosphoribosylformylglycinamidine synthase subunit PurQ [Rickettsiales bacterium]
MKTGVIQFPGSNCERDAFTILQQEGMNPELLWHNDAVIPTDLDLIVVPGGFTYGDYLRVGAMAAHSAIMQEVKRHAERGGKVIGICNGFQILCETGLLPGALMRNRNLHFICKAVPLRVESNQTAFTNTYDEGQVISIPIAHHDGCYFAEEDELKAMNDNQQVVFRYCGEDGMIQDDNNPNGSVENIAGIMNKNGNVMGMMPHPERHADPHVGGTDGRGLFLSLIQSAS